MTPDAKSGPVCDGREGLLKTLEREIVAAYIRGAHWQLKNMECQEYLNKAARDYMDKRTSALASPTAMQDRADVLSNTLLLCMDDEGVTDLATIKRMWFFYKTGRDEAIGSLSWEDLVRRAARSPDNHPLPENPQGASAEHEPVGYRWRWGNNDIWTHGKDKPSGYPETGFTCEPLYAAPLTTTSASTPETPSVTQDMVMVPKAAIDWLLGEGPDDKGFWFGDGPGPVSLGRYWWRTTFRRMLSVTQDMVMVPREADYGLIEALHDTRDWEAEDYTNAKLSYAMQISRIEKALSASPIKPEIKE